MDFHTLIKERRPHLKPNSVDAYATSLRIVFNLVKPPPSSNPLEFLYDHATLLEALKIYKHTTQKNYLNAVIVALLGDETEPGQKALDEYGRVRDLFNQEYSDHVRAGKKTEKQKANWIEWEAYLEIVDQLGEKVKHLKSGPSKAEWSVEHKMNYQDYLLCLIYSKYPLRNDLNHTKVITKTVYNKLKPEDMQEHNFIVRHSSNKYFLILNEYKTSKKWGQKKIELSEEILRPLRRWLRHNRSGFLLITPAGGPMTSNGISKALTRIGRKMRGKPLGTSLIRHSYLSHKYKDVEEQKEKDSYVMGHSLQTQSDYILKDE